MLYRLCVCLNDPVLQKGLIQEIDSDDIYIMSIKEKKNMLNYLAKQTCDMFVLSLSVLPDPVEGSIDLLKSLPESPALVLFTESEMPSQRASYLAMGCSTVLYSGLEPVVAGEAISSLIEEREVIQSEIIKTSQVLTGPRLADFVSSSKSMQAFMEVVKKVVKSDTSLLLMGETGVGKERLARAIHEESHRSEGPFIAINCAALPDNLLESELFGYEQGAFTGATRSRRGAFEMAHKGTLFLDEIGDMPLHLQVKILRVLQEKEFNRLGGEKSISVDVRIMAATNRNLKDAVDDKEFRQDLYYRLSVISLTLPPLRERHEDIKELIYSYIRYLSPRIGTEVIDISNDALAAMEEYEWPGNVRELINVIERAMLLCNGTEIKLNDLPEEIAYNNVQNSRKILAASIISSKIDLPEEYIYQKWKDTRKTFVELIENAYFDKVLEICDGKIKDVAKHAGLDTRSVFEKMRKYRLDKNNYKQQDNSE